jgi:dTDP-4-dehydrorhamnose reductase
LIAVDLLVFGQSGQLARQLAQIGRGAEHRIECLGRPRLDVTKLEDVRRALERHPHRVIVNCAAYTAVDRAEAEAAEADRVNRIGAANVAAAAAEADLPLLHVSTDYVFDGRKPTPYAETDPVGPLSVYAASKEAGEREVRARHTRHVILRTSWLYGPSGDNFVTSMLRLGKERPKLGVVADQVGSPTSVRDLADAILTIAQRIGHDRPGRYGTFHYCGAGAVSRHDFARAIFEEAARFGYRPPELTPITTAEYPTPARRPANSALDCSRIAAIYDIVQRPWRESLAECIAELCASGREPRIG